MGTAARDLEQQRDRQADRSAAQCRICATDIATDDGGMHIFAEDGRRHYLQTKIRKYLHILVSETRAHFRAYLRAAGILFFPSPFFFPLSFSLSFSLLHFFFFSKFVLPLSFTRQVSRSRAGRGGISKFTSTLGRSQPIFRDRSKSHTDLLREDSIATIFCDHRRRS